MRTFVWLASSGLLWLVLIQFAPDAGVPPQLVSLARSIYIGTFAIFMMIEIRRPTDVLPAMTLNPKELLWYLAPTVSVVALWWISPSLQMTWRLGLILGAFYAAQLCVQLLRTKRNSMRSGSWDLLPPLLLALLLLTDKVAWVIAGLSLAFLATLLAKRYPPKQHVADSLIMQLPSLCIAPVALIALRDTFELSTAIDRSHMEVGGMVVNAIGAAIWTSVIMRSKRIARHASALWGAGCIGAFTLAASGAATSPVNYAFGALIAAELLRGSLWLGLTAVLADSQRWQGFAINAAATTLPIAALLIARRWVLPHQIIAVYAALHAAVPLVLWMLKPRPVKSH